MSSKGDKKAAESLRAEVLAKRANKRKEQDDPKDPEAGAVPPSPIVRVGARYRSHR